MSKIPIIRTPKESRVVFFDANVFSSGQVKKLWDWHTSVNQLGSSEDPLRDTIFDGVLLPEYTVDELVVFEATTPAQVNTLKKHLVLLAILKDLPVLKPMVKCLGLSQVNEVEPDFRPFLIDDKTQVMRLVTQRLIDLTQGQTSKAVQDAIDDKKRVADLARAHPFAVPTTAVISSDKRSSLGDWIAADMKSHAIVGKPTVKAFYELCQRMSEAKRRRVLTPPAGMNAKNFYKSADPFGEHIDFFHINYTPLVSHFVTDDRAVQEIVKALASAGLVSCQVLSSSEYKRNWIRSRLVTPTTASSANA